MVCKCYEGWLTEKRTISRMHAISAECHCCQIIFKFFKFLSLSPSSIVSRVSPSEIRRLNALFG